MRRFKVSLAALALAALSLAQTASINQAQATIRRVGDKLACLCTSCNNTVATCPMLHCHYAEPAKEKIAEMAAAGASDQAIIDAFVKKEGIRALASPPTEGFNLVGWVMPFIAILLGLAFTWWILQRFRRKPATAAGPEVDAALLARYQQRIDKDLERLD